MTTSLSYIGKVRHRRFHQKAHNFTYNLHMLFFDIALIQESFQCSKLISMEKFNWFSYRRKNYLDGLSTPLDQAARELINKKCSFYPKGKIFLLTNLACLGYCFNPISIYFVFKENSSEVEALIIEVKNTPWMEKHIYIQNVRRLDSQKNVYTCSFKKEMHVSPFMSMDYQYRFNFKMNDNRIIVHMDSLQSGEKHFDATLTLDANNNPSMWFLLQHALITYKVTAAIYWQALKLWLKNVTFYPHPAKKSS